MAFFPNVFQIFCPIGQTSSAGTRSDYMHLHPEALDEPHLLTKVWVFTFALCRKELCDQSRAWKQEWHAGKYISTCKAVSPNAENQRIVYDILIGSSKRKVPSLFMCYLMEYTFLLNIFGLSCNIETFSSLLVCCIRLSLSLAWSSLALLQNRRKWFCGQYQRKESKWLPITRGEESNDRQKSKFPPDFFTQVPGIPLKSIGLPWSIDAI